MARSLCGDSISSRRGLLASLWTLVSVTTLVSFLGAFCYAVSSMKNGDNENNDDYYYNQGEGGSQDEYVPEIVVTTRALAFAALWTAVLSTLMSVFGTVILGWQSPLTGQYYTCCSSSVHRTTPLGLGSFIGALLMLSNLTLICSVLFGEFEIRDYREADERGNNGDRQGAYAYQNNRQASMVFSILCMFLTIVYAGFAALTFAYANSIMDEHAFDEREEAMLSTRNKTGQFMGYDGYIGERFDVGRPRNGPAGFVSPSAPDATLA